MYALETIYLDDGKATGFVKPYYDHKYSFVALLPNEDIAIQDYVASLSGSGFINTLNNAQSIDVQTALPKFTYDYEIMMNDTLITLGITDAFDPEKANFGKMADISEENLFISTVLHKTFIAVDELGTKAGAATSVGISKSSAPLHEKQVILDRPFVYAIVDNATNLPVFLGIVATMLGANP